MGSDLKPGKVVALLARRIFTRCRCTGAKPTIKSSSQRANMFFLSQPFALVTAIQTGRRALAKDYFRFLNMSRADALSNRGLSQVDPSDQNKVK